MFEVVRWPGPESAGTKGSEGRLSLQQLNARARERAESRRIQAAAGGEAPPDIASSEVPLPSRSGVNGAAQISSADETVSIETRENVKGASKKEKKRKKRQEIGEIREKLEKEIQSNYPPEPHLEPKVKKSKKRKVQEEEQDGLNDTVQLEIQEQNLLNASEEKLPNPFNREISPAENTKKKKKKKKKKRKIEAEPESEVRIIATESMEEPAALSEVSASLLPALHASSGNVSDTERQDVAEEADVDADVKRKKKKKRRKVENEAVEAEDDTTIVVDDPMLDGTPELPVEKVEEVTGQEFDLSKIEKDVEMIMGKLKSNVSGEVQGKGPPVLPWMRDPLEISALEGQPLNQVPGLDMRLQEALRNTGIEALFPVQVAVWNETVGPGSCERDLCICSPTGSGKTLSYALPVVQKLSTRVLRRLRALIVLPTRDLATQVKGVFDTLAPAVGLKVGLAVGQTSITTEAAELVSFPNRMVHSFGNDEASDDDFADSCVDILVATPGRLMDHLHNTKGFTLQHLYYLIVDETDRLLRQSYQDWLSNVLNTVAATEARNILLNSPNSVSTGYSIRSIRTIRHLGRERGMRSTLHPRLMKMVLSATLTRDPAKIAQLALHYPMYIAQSAVENRYQLPEQLQAFKLVCKPGEKPLYLVALLQQLVGQQTIVFTASVVATHRLFTLLSFFEGLSFKVVEYSSLQHQQARSNSLAKFRGGEAQVLVASDAMTRGMDVEGVGNVVNYDMPVYAKTYVHRVGRTARAGRAGSSYTILRREEVRHFKSLLKKADNSSCKNYSLPVSAKEELYERYLKALEMLKEVTVEESTTPAPASKGSKLQVSAAEQNVSGPDELYM